MDNPPPLNPPPPVTPPPIAPPPGANPPLPPPPPCSGSPENEIRNWNMLCHLGALSGGIIPLGNIVGPLLVWQLKKNEFPSVIAHGKAALNFQLTMLIAAFASLVGLVVLSFICIGYLFLPVLILIGLAALIFPIIAAVKASNGEPYQYPCSLDLIK